MFSHFAIMGAGDRESGGRGDRREKNSERKRAGQKGAGGGEGSSAEPTELRKSILTLCPFSAPVSSERAR